MTCYILICTGIQHWCNTHIKTCPVGSLVHESGAWAASGLPVMPPHDGVLGGKLTGNVSVRLPYVSQNNLPWCLMSQNDIRHHAAWCHFVHILSMWSVAVLNRTVELWASFTSMQSCSGSQAHVKSMWSHGMPYTSFNAICILDGKWPHEVNFSLLKFGHKNNLIFWKN